MARGQRRSSRNKFNSARALQRLIDRRISLESGKWVLEDDDGTEVQVTSGKEVKYISGGGLDINFTDTSSGTDSDPYDITLTVNPTDANAVNVAASDLVLIADASDSNLLKKAQVGYSWDGNNFYINGKVGIGVESPTYALEIPNNSGVTGTARANAFVTYSSRKLKKNIDKIKDPLNIVNELRGVTFDWKDTDKREIGLIAEEVHKVLPEIVCYDDNRPAALDYPKLTALLIECVKELQTKINHLEKKFVPHDIDIKKER
tara:strand:- start:38 stop:820 length:783 start_codon:yes stop_codon:yes gene_type:complete